MTGSKDQIGLLNVWRTMKTYKIPGQKTWTDKNYKCKRTTRGTKTPIFMEMNGY